MHEIRVPAELAAAVWNPEAPAVEEAVTASLFPDERDPAAQTRDLRRLGVSLDLAVAEVEPQLLLLLRRDILIPEDCN